MSRSAHVDIGGTLGELVEWSPGRVRLICPDQPAELLDIRVEGRRVEGLRVSECARREDGRVSLEVVSSDTRGETALWRLSHSGLIRASTPSADPGASPERIPARGHYTESARLERLEWLRAQSRTPLPYFQNTGLDAGKLVGNVENLIGTIEIPVGVAGPLSFIGDAATGMIHAPYATTEGALVASATRGATAITRAGGVTTRVIRQQMYRVPVFNLANMQGAFLFSRWVEDHVGALQGKVEAVSRHAKLLSVEPILMGNTVHLRFLYKTGDAAGQNMTTTCTWHACQWLIRQVAHIPEIEVSDFMIDGNMSGDKKVNLQSFISGRGIRVTAECFVPRAVLQQVLKVTPEQVARGVNTGLMGGVAIGMVGYNINVANTIAALFTATGQDIACVHESSLGQLNIQAVDDGIYASMLLPSLIIGTVGGGTGLPGQRQLLEMLGCAGSHGVSRLAEIICGFCLALDLSTISAIIGGQFAMAHERLGRNRPTGFQLDELTPAFVQPLVRDALGEPVEVSAVEARPLEVDDSIITELAARHSERFMGFQGLTLALKRAGAGGQERVKVVAKVKPSDTEVIAVASNMAAMCGPLVAEPYRQFRDRLGFSGCHVRELAVYRQRDPRFTAHAPRFYGALSDDARDTHVLLIEDLSGAELLNSVDQPERWTQAHLRAAIAGIAQVHAIWYGKTEALRDEPWIGHVDDAQSMGEMLPLWEALGAHARDEFPEWVNDRDLSMYRTMLRRHAQWRPRQDRHVRTLIHGDFNPRNIAFRREPDGALRLCAFDWELASLHLPQRDLVELLAYQLPAGATHAHVAGWVEHHRVALGRALGQTLDPAVFHDGYRLCLLDFMLTRVSLYFVAHTLRHYSFMERLFRNLRRLLRFEFGDDPLNQAYEAPI